MAYLGSHGRIRLCLIAIALALACRGWTTILRSPTRWTIESGNGDTVVLLASRYNHSTLEGWDPKSGKRWVIADGLFRDTKPFWRGQVTWLPNENALAWVDGGGDSYTLHLVQRDQPTDHQTWNFTGLSSGWVQVIALMHQQRFAVMQAFSRLGHHTHHQELLVVELKTGRVISTDDSPDQWVSFMPNLQLFTFRDMEGIAVARKLGIHGEWETVDPPDPEPKLTPDEVDVVVSPTGNIRILSEGELLSRDEEDVLLYVNGLSPQGRWYFATNPHGDPSTYFGVPNTNQIWRHNFHGMRVSQMEFQSGDRGLAYVDDNGDAQWFDLDQRKITHVGPFGSAAGLVRLSSALLALCVPFAILSFREARLGWAICDATIVSLLLQTSAYVLSGAHEAVANLELSSYPVLQFMLNHVGGMVVSVALYWAFGNGTFGKRLFLGLAYLALASIPQWIDNRFLPDSDYLEFLRGHGRGDGYPKDSTILAAVTPFVALLLLCGFSLARFFRWRIAVPELIDVSPDTAFGRFGLKSLLAMVTACALTMPSFPHILEIHDGRTVLWRVGTSFAIPIAAGVCLSLVFFSRSRWMVLLAAALLAVVLVVGPKPDETGYGNDWYYVTEAKLYAAIPLLATVGLPCWLARRRGFRWTREPTT